MQEKNPMKRLTWRGWLLMVSVMGIGIAATRFLEARFFPELPTWLSTVLPIFWVGASITAAFWMDLGRASGLEAAWPASAIVLGSAATFAAGEFFSLRWMMHEEAVVLSWCALVILLAFLIPSSRNNILNRWRQFRAGGDGDGPQRGG